MRRGGGLAAVVVAVLLVGQAVGTQPALVQRMQAGDLGRTCSPDWFRIDQACGRLPVIICLPGLGTLV